MIYIIPLIIIVILLIVIKNRLSNKNNIDDTDNGGKQSYRLIENTSSRLANAKQLLEKYKLGALNSPYGGNIKLELNVKSKGNIPAEAKFIEYMQSLNREYAIDSIEAINRNKKVIAAFLKEIDEFDKNIDRQDFELYKSQGGKLRSWEKYSMIIDDIIKQYAKNNIVNNWNFKVYYLNKHGKEISHITYNYDTIRKWILNNR